MGAIWHIELLGKLRARRGDEVCSRFPTRKTAALLARLAFEPRTHPRDVLIEMLWPGEDVRRARNSLSQALTALRRLLEPDGIVPRGAVLGATRAAVELVPGAVSTDISLFEAALARAASGSSNDHRGTALREATALYRGPLLDGLDPDWVSPERARLREVAYQAWLGLARVSDEEGAFDAALDAARRAMALDPLSEGAPRLLMELYRAHGEPNAAIGVFDVFAETLHRELGAAPSKPLADLAIAASREIPEPTRIERPEGRTVGSGTATDAAPGTRLFGRAEEIAAAKAALESGARLLTITGLGGIGKTRLAHALAAALSDEMEPGAVTFCALEGLDDAASLPTVVLGALDGSAAAAAVDPRAALAAALADRPRALVLDNLEQLGEGAGLFVAELLDAAPALRCVATSRRPLGIQGERLLRLGPLALPDAATRVDPTALVGSPGVAFLLDRVRARRPSFRADYATLRDLADLVGRLEGYPLALGLAAARLRVLAPRQLLERLAPRLRLLADRSGENPARHRTLQAALDGSFEALSADVRQLFAALSVFRGGLGIEEAEAVTGAAGTLDRLEDLIEESLVELEEPDDPRGVPRYRILEAVRDYAAEHLDETERARLREKHARCFLALAEAAAAELTGPEQDRWRARLLPEEANLRAALEWSLASIDADADERRLRFGAALGHYWQRRGTLHEGRASLERILRNTAPTPTVLRDQVLVLAADLALRQGDSKRARVLVAESLEVRRALGDPVKITRAMHNLGMLAYHDDDDRTAERWLEAAAVRERELGDDRVLGNTLANLGRVKALLGDYAAARAHGEEGIALARARQDRLEVVNLEASLGITLAEAGDPEAQALLERCADELETLDRRGFAICLADLLTAVVAEGDHERARELADRVEAAAREVGLTHLLGMASAARGDMALSADAVSEAAGHYRAAIPTLLAANQPMLLVGVIERVVAAATASGDHREAAALLGAAEAERETRGRPLAPRDRPRAEQARAALAEALGDDFEALLARGAAFGIHHLARTLIAERSPSAA